MINDSIIRLGDKGPNVGEIQKALGIKVDKDFGPATDKAVREYQKKHGLVVDGKVGYNTLKLLGVEVSKKSTSGFDEKYKGVTIKGSVFPDKPFVDYKITLNSEIVKEYLPALKEALGTKPLGLQLLCTIMAYKEGFRKGTRSYRYNNPGNIGNTDSGANKSTGSLVDGIRLQADYINKIIAGKHSAYPMGKLKVIPPYYSPEIAKHSKMYGMSPYVPGYEFIFTGQLDQFVKIYSTGARAGNGYLSMIDSYFKQNGLEITPQSKIQDIIKMTK